MKTIINKFLALSVAALSLVACNVDNIGALYQHEEDNNGVSFTQAAITDTEIGAATTTYVVTVSRIIATSEQSVNITTTLDGIGVPSSVKFNAGEYTTDLVLDLSKMSVGKAYKGTITVDPQQASSFGIGSVSVTFQKAYTWAKYGTGTYHYNGDDCFFSGDDPGLEIYKAEGFDVYYITNWGAGATFNFSIQNGYVIVDDGPTGYTHSSYGAVRVRDCSTYFSDWDPVVDGMGYYDKATKTFYFSVIYYVSAGYFGYGFESFEMN